MSRNALTKEQVLSLRTKISELLEQDQWALFFPEGDGPGMHSIICGEDPQMAMKAIKAACDRYDPEKLI